MASFLVVTVVSPSTSPPSISASNVQQPSSIPISLYMQKRWSPIHATTPEQSWRGTIAFVVSATCIIPLLLRLFIDKSLKQRPEAEKNLKFTSICFPIFFCSQDKSNVFPYCVESSGNLYTPYKTTWSYDFLLGTNGARLFTIVYPPMSLPSLIPEVFVNI